MRHTRRLERKSKRQGKGKRQGKSKSKHQGKSKRQGKRQSGGFVRMDQIPPHHRLVNRLFEDDPIRQIYGTSHIRTILKRDNRLAEEKELDALEDEIYHTRKAYLEQHAGIIYDGEKVVGFNDEVFQNRYRPPRRFTVQFYLSYKLSPETIQELRPFYEKVRLSMKTEDGVEFLRHALSLKDYVVNIVFLLDSLFNIQNVTERREASAIMDGTEKKIDEWIMSVVTRIMNMYITTTDKKNKYANEEEHYHIIPDGTYLYRGFKRQRGPLNIDRGFSFFVWDAIECVSYTLPNELMFFDDNNNNTPKSHIERYCSQVGGVAEVHTTKELRLLNFAKASTLRYVLAEMKAKGAPEKVITYLKEGWVLSNNTSTKYRRKSIYHKDMEVVKWLQQSGYNGYVAMDVEGLHDEIVIFNIKDSVKISHIYTSDDFNIPLCTEPYRSLGIGLIAS